MNLLIQRNKFNLTNFFQQYINSHKQTISIQKFVKQITMNRKQNWLILVFMIANILINFIWSEPLYLYSLQFIIKIQKYAHPFLNYFFAFFTLIVDPAFIMIGVCIFMLLMKNKAKAYNMVIFILFNTYLMTIFKAFYAAPRPYWSHKNVQNIGYYCPRQYGNPSGHSWFVAIMAINLVLEYLDSKRKKPLYIMIAVILTIFVPFSRIYLGAHSINQVLQGLFLGFCMVYLYSWGGLKKKIDCLLSTDDYSQKKFSYLIIGLMHIAYIVAFYINKQQNQGSKQISKIWIANIKQKCNRQIDEYHLNFVILLLNSVLVNAITGLSIGYSNLKKSTQGALYLSGKWRINTIKYSSAAYIFWILVELSLFASGFILLFPIFLTMGNNDLSKLIYLNLSVVLTSYIYSSKTCSTLFAINLIQQKENIDEIKVQ